MKRRHGRGGGDDDGASVAAAAVAGGVVCSFCGQTRAAVALDHGKTKLCLLHYYTTLRGGGDDVEDETVVEIFDQEMYDQQAPAVQDLFASVYLEVRQELQEATALHNQDPLFMLHQWSKKSTTTMTTKAAKHRSANTTSTAGGFLPLEPAAPSRLLSVQQSHEALLRRMNQPSTAATHTTTSKSTPDLTQRRQPTRASVWNSVMNDDAGGGLQKKKNPVETASTRKMVPSSTIDVAVGVTCSSCGNDTSVEIVQSSQRRQDMAKAEVWSNKDRESQVSQRYRCGQCGKVWDEHE
jgi:membrane-associated HD superfamily phosphohydrolase